MIALDDNIEEHPKFVGLSAEAFRLWVYCIGYCRRNTTDGYVPHAVAIKKAAKRYAEELCKPPVGAPQTAPLWSKIDGGYAVHDYLDWNPSKRDVEEAREQKRSAAKKGGLASGQARRAAMVGPQLKQEATKNEAPCFDSGSTESNPDPVRSGPVRSEEISPVPLSPLSPPEKPRPAAAAAAAALTEAGRQVRRKLLDSKKLGHLATADFASRVAAHCSEYGHSGHRSLADVLTAIDEADSKIADLEAGNEFVPSSQVIPMVIGFVKSGPRQTGRKPWQKPVQPGGPSQSKTLEEFYADKVEDPSGAPL